jgi:hypothetical protein
VFHKPLLLKPVSSERKLRDFLVYDLEWIPGRPTRGCPAELVLRMGGVFDGERYRWYESVEAFLRNELTSKNRGKWFYAHAGGLADMNFLFRVLVDMAERIPDFRVRASFSGSSAIIVHVSRGKNAWHFVDSYWLFRDSLKKIGKSIGMEKTGPEEEMDEDERRDWYANTPLSELVPYNQNDCEILWHAIDKFENALLSLGGQLQMTLASSGMYLFRRRYLKREINTSASINDVARKAYFASRVEVFREKMPHNAYYYDINSSFPYSMTKPQPGPLILNTDELPDEWLEESSPHIYMADVGIEVPECFIPSVPCRVGQRLFFPFGRWRSWLSSVDLQLLMREGGKIHKVYEVMEFEPFSDLAVFASDLYEKRRTSTDEFERLTYKLLLNSVYGKFAERESKAVMHLNPTRDAIARLKQTGVDYEIPGVWTENINVPIPHMHVPISMHITALSRRYLFDYMTMSFDYHYCDTDGFSTADSYPTGDALGALKLEKKTVWSQFHAPKVYAFQKDDGTFVMKAKGMTIREGPKCAACMMGRHDGCFKSSCECMNKKHPKEDLNRVLRKRFFSLIEGEEVRVTRMSRIKENLARGTLIPNERMIVKRLTGELQRKRFHYPDGFTRAWHVSELEKERPTYA